MCCLSLLVKELNSPMMLEAPSAAKPTKLLIGICWLFRVCIIMLNNDSPLEPVFADWPSYTFSRSSNLVLIFPSFGSKYLTNAVKHLVVETSVDSSIIKENGLSLNCFGQSGNQETWFYTTLWSGLPEGREGYALLWSKSSKFLLQRCDALRAQTHGRLCRAIFNRL